MSVSSFFSHTLVLSFLFLGFMANDLRFSIRHEIVQLDVATFSCRSHNSNEMQVSSKEFSEIFMRNDNRV